VVGPAAATSAALTYTCPVLGQAKQFTMVADTDAPGRIAYGETVAPTATGTVTVPEDVTTTIRDTLMAKKIDGKADVAATVDETARPWTLAIPQTNVPQRGTLTLTGTGPAGTFEGTKVGSIYDIAVGNFTATLNFYDANGTPSTPPNTQVVCILNPGQATAVDSIRVVRDTTSTTVAARDINKGARAKAKVKVASEHGLTPKGKVKAKLFRDGQRLQTKQVFLRDGKRVVRFVRLAKAGTYTVRAKYVGSANFKGSSQTDTFTVG